MDGPGRNEPLPISPRSWYKLAEGESTPVPGDGEPDTLQPLACDGPLVEGEERRELGSEDDGLDGEVEATQLPEARESLARLGLFQQPLAGADGAQFADHLERVRRIVAQPFALASRVHVGVVQKFVPDRPSFVPPRN